MKVKKFDFKIEVTKGDADMIEITTVSELFSVAKNFTAEQLTIYLDTLRKSLEHYQETYKLTEDNNLEVNSWGFGFSKTSKSTKKLTNDLCPDVIKAAGEPLICCGTCLFMNDGECNNEEPCIDFSEHVQINGL